MIFHFLVRGGDDVVAKSKVQEWLTKENLLLLEGWARDGLTDEQIAHNMGINVRTLYQWKKKHVQIFQALKKGKEVVDREVENALLKLALGFEYEEETVTNKGQVVKVRKYQPPNTTAIIFWLKNRKPDVWRDKQNIEHTGKDDGPLQVEYVAEWGRHETQD